MKQLTQSYTLTSEVSDSNLIFLIICPESVTVQCAINKNLCNVYYVLTMSQTLDEVLRHTSSQLTSTTIPLGRHCWAHCAGGDTEAHRGKPRLAER